MLQFIFMLTHHDVTVADALAVYESIRDIEGLRYVGFKDVGLPAETLAELAARIRGDGRDVFLEVVSEHRDDELRSAAMGLDLGVDWLLGGTNADAVLALIRSRGADVRYCPFPGRIVGHPSVLEGTAQEIAASAAELGARTGVYGLDLLAYRHPTDPEGVLAAVVDAVEVPVIAAGSVDSAARIAALDRLGAWGFTVGGAVFERVFPAGPTPCEQILSILASAAGEPAG